MRETMDERLTATQVADSIGVPAPTIRSWERRYGWPEPSRTQGGHRRYSQADVRGLQAIRDEIARGRSAQQAVVLLRRQAARRRGQQVSELVDAAVAIDPWRTRRALAGLTTALTVEEAIEGVILPAVREIGLRWERGACDVAGEHVVTGQIRQWLGQLVQESRPRRPAPTVVLSTGPSDFHSLGLEAFAVVLSRRGLNVLLLGALTPVGSLVHAVTSLGAAAAVISCHMPITRRAALDSIRSVATLRSALVFYAGNGFATARSRKGVPGTYLGTDMPSAAAEIAGRLLPSPDDGRAG